MFFVLWEVVAYPHVFHHERINGKFFVKILQIFSRWVFTIQPKAIFGLVEGFDGHFSEIIFN
jgi:hypothetical protein